jgi:outer membrane protein assembly factor BamB
MFSTFATQMRSATAAGRLRLSWLRRIDGLVRVPMRDPQQPDRAFVVVYVEKERTYRVEAFRPDDGTTLWSSVLPNGGYGSPAIRDGQLLVLSQFTDVVAFDTATGAQLWTFKTEARIRSAIAVIDGLAVFSSGGQLFGLDGQGLPRLQASVAGGFLFGLAAAGPDSILSLGTSFAASGESHLYLYAFSRAGELRWCADLDAGDIASSDTSGVLVHDGVAYVGGVDRLFAFDAASGKPLWQQPLPGFAHRAICTTDGSRLYVTTVDGQLEAFDLVAGTPRWRRKLGESGIWMPASVAGSRVAVVADGVLRVLDAAEGLLLQEFAVGHCPYSACTLDGDTLLLGGGDPPYYGLLFAFRFEAEPETGLRCFLERERFVLSQGEPIELTVTVSGLPQLVDAIALDLTSVGGPATAEPVRREGNTSVFSVQPTPGRHWGIYAIPVAIDLAGARLWTTLRLELADADELPARVLLADVPRRTQEAPHFSGAACIQAVRGLYGEEVAQDDMRAMVDAILEAAPGYSPFQLWRLVARRAMLTGAHSAAELPEFR